MGDQRKKSAKAFKKAQKVIPGGVNSPARAFSAVDMDPILLRKVRVPIFMISTVIST